jgi:hypothetical protein
MKVKILRSFTAFVGGSPVSVCEGQEIDMPAKQDWVRAGLAVPIKAAAVKAEEAVPESEAPASGPAEAGAETAAVQPPEAAILPRGRKRKGS